MQQRKEWPVNRKTRLSCQFPAKKMQRIKIVCYKKNYSSAECVKLLRNYFGRMSDTLFVSTANAKIGRKKALPTKCGMLKNILEAAQYCKNNMQRTKETVFALWRLRPTPCFHFFVSRHNQLFYLLLWPLLHPFNLLHI